MDAVHKTHSAAFELAKDWVTAYVDQTVGSAVRTESEDGQKPDRRGDIRNRITNGPHSGPYGIMSTKWPHC